MPCAMVDVCKVGDRVKNNVNEMEKHDCHAMRGENGKRLSTSVTEWIVALLFI